VLPPALADLELDQQARLAPFPLTFTSANGTVVMVKLPTNKINIRQVKPANDGRFLSIRFSPMHMVMHLVAHIFHPSHRGRVQCSRLHATPTKDQTA
jgi:hypothetical protein